MRTNSDANINNFDKSSISAKKASLMALIILVISVFILQRVMAEITKIMDPQGTFLKLVVIFHNFLATFLPVCLFVVFLKLPVRKTLGLYSPSWKKVILAIIIAFFLFFALNFTIPLIAQPSKELIESSRSIAAYSNFPEFLLAFLTVAIAAVVSDEIFYRGILLQNLMIRYGKIIAILVTALLTALFHTHESFKMIHAFTMGIIFASSVIWTKSLYTSLILHALHNSLALLPQ